MKQEYEMIKPGDVVRISKLGDNTPKMLVINMVYGENKKLKGVECMWTDKNDTINVHIFNTRDIEKL